MIVKISQMFHPLLAIAIAFGLPTIILAWDFHAKTFYKFAQIPHVAVLSAMIAMLSSTIFFQSGIGSKPFAKTPLAVDVITSSAIEEAFSTTFTNASIAKDKGSMPKFLFMEGEVKQTIKDVSVEVNGVLQYCDFITQGIEQERGVAFEVYCGVNRVKLTPKM